jgi:uncharacterized protein
MIVAKIFKQYTGKLYSMKMVKSIFKVAGLVLLVLGARWASKEIQMNPRISPDGDRIFLAGEDDSEMNAAMQQARDSFGQFWTIVSEDYQRLIPVYTDAMVKASFSDPHKPANIEHMWVSGIEYDGQTITGTLESIPEHIPSISKGDQVQFSLSQVSDWIYEENGIAQGAFTVKLLRRRMSEKERMKHDSLYPYRFE